MALPNFEDLVADDQKPDTSLPSFDSLQPDDQMQAAPDVSKTESALRGGAQGLSFGFADELTGALESMLGPKKYEQARDESRQNYDRAEQANPKTYAAGEITGAVAPAIAATVASGGTATPAIAEAIAPTTLKGMAALGAATGLGHSNADLTKGDVAGAAKDTARGAAEGFVAGGAAKTLGAAAENLLPALKKLAFEGGDSALGLNTQAIKKMGMDKTEDVVTHALKPSPYLPDGKSIIGGIQDNTQSMLDKAVKVKQAAGQDTGAILDIMDSHGTVPEPILNNVYDVIKSHAERINSLAPELGEPVVAKYNKAANDFLNVVTNPKSPASFRALGNLKEVIGDIAYKHGSPVESQQALQDAYHAINEGLTQAVDAGSIAVQNPALSAAYTSGKKAYDMSLRAIQGLEGKSAKDVGGKWVGFGDVMAGGIGAKIGGPAGFVAGVAAKRAIEARGAQTIGKVSYTAAEKLESALTKNPQILGKYLPVLQQAHQRGQLAATNYVLQQRDPDYAETLKKLDEAHTGDNPNE